MSSVNRVALGIAHLGLGLLALSTAACGAASSSLTPSASVSTLMAGWDQKFKLDWTVEPENGEARRIRGYVSNVYGQYAEPVRVLAQAFDRSGTVVGQRIEWVPGGVSGGGRSYFEVRHLPAAERYVVTVWDYAILEGESTMR